MKTKGLKFNIIDVFIIITILVVIVGIIVRYDVAGKVGFVSKGDMIEMTVLIEKIQARSGDYFVPGDTLLINSGNTKLGEIKEVIDIRPAVQYVSTITGDISKTEIPGRIDVTLNVICEGRQTDEGFLINGIIFTAAGKTFLTTSDGIEVSLMVLSVKNVEKTSQK